MTRHCGLAVTSLACLVLFPVAASEAAVINISAGEAATAIGTMQGDGPGAEVILGNTWNNVAEVAAPDPNAPQALLDSAGGVTALTAFTFSSGSFSDARGDATTAGGHDTNDSLISRFGVSGALGQAPSNSNPMLTISGFSANQQLGSLRFYHLVDDANPRGSMDVTVNGVLQGTLAFNTSGSVLTFASVIADANGEVVVTSTNYVGAVSLETTPVPEPSTLALVGLASAGLLTTRRRLA